VLIHTALTILVKELKHPNKYVKILEKIIDFYKGYEHGKNKKISGTDLDNMGKEALEYMDRLRELRKQIEKRVEEKSIEQVYKDVFGMLEALLKKKSESSIIKEFNEKLIKQGKFPQRFLSGLKFISKVKKEFEKEEKAGKKKKKQIDQLTGKEIREVDQARKIAAEITNALIEYTQRCDFLSMDRTRFVIKGKKKTAEVFFLNDVFVVDGKEISVIKNSKLVGSNTEELKKQLLAHKDKRAKIDFSAVQLLKKHFGDFELSY
jgi:hypothetical protein